MSETAPTWQVSDESANKAKIAKFAQERPREFASLFANLNKIMQLLLSGNRFGSFQTKFFRSEGAGVYRIGQTAVLGAKESRLYIYPDAKMQIMHILTIGTKERQSDDINEAKGIVKMIESKKDVKPDEEAAK